MRIPEPLILTPGETQYITRAATPEHRKDNKGLRAIGHDVTGGVCYFDGPQAGKYTLSVVYKTDDARLKRAAKSANAAGATRTLAASR